MANYHLDPQAVVGENCRIGFGSVINAGAVLEDGVHIGNNVTVHSGACIGTGTRVADNAVIGRRPTPAATSTVRAGDDLRPAVIGPQAIIGAGAVIYAGTTLGEGVMVADLASVRERCRIGRYTIVGRGVAIENAVEIGEYVKMQTNAYITAYTVIEDRVFIAPMVTTTNDNFMGRTDERFAGVKGPRICRGARIGGGVVLLPGIVIAEETFVAAGALVTRDTEARTVYMGVPARPLRPVAERELLE